MRSRFAVVVVIVLAAVASSRAAMAQRLVTGDPLASRHHHHHEAQSHRPPVSPPCPGLTPSPHFTTPQAAMRYLAHAWNHDDLDAMCHVTDPMARRVLDAMHSEAVHLQLTRCRYETVGLYGCTFRHDYPRHLHATGVGHAFMEVAAARTPGWYTTGSIGCG